MILTQNPLELPKTPKLVLAREVIENTKEFASMTTITMMHTGASFCVYSHSFEQRTVFVGIGEITKAFDRHHFCPDLIKHLLWRQSNGDRWDVEVTIIANSLSDYDEAKAIRDASVTALRPIWQEPFDPEMFKSLHPRILCVQTGAIYDTAYEAAKSLGLSIPTVYQMIDRPPSFSSTRTGLQFVRTAERSRSATSDHASQVPGNGAIMSMTNPGVTLMQRFRAVPRGNHAGLLALENEARAKAGLAPITLADTSHR